MPACGQSRPKKSGRGKYASLGPNFQIGKSTRVGNALRLRCAGSDTIAGNSLPVLIWVNRQVGRNKAIGTAGCCSTYTTPCA
jgi:hypothetical protein